MDLFQYVTEHVKTYPTFSLVVSQSPKSGDRWTSLRGKTCCNESNCRVTFESKIETLTRIVPVPTYYVSTVTLSLLQVTNKEFLLTSSIHFLWCREVMRRLKTSIRLSLILNSQKYNYKKSIREGYRVWGVKGNKTEWKSHMLGM